jgi:hypothetical protein
VNYDAALSFLLKSTPPGEEPDVPELARKLGKPPQWVHVALDRIAAARAKTLSAERAKAGKRTREARAIRTARPAPAPVLPVTPSPPRLCRPAPNPIIAARMRDHRHRPDPARHDVSRPRRPDGSLVRPPEPGSVVLATCVMIHGPGCLNQVDSRKHRKT